MEIFNLLGTSCAKSDKISEKKTTQTKTMIQCWFVLWFHLYTESAGSPQDHQVAM